MTDPIDDKRRRIEHIADIVEGRAQNTWPPLAPDLRGDGGGSGDSGTSSPPCAQHHPCHPLTDLGNAERFAERNRDRFIHVTEIGWLAWDGRRWTSDRADYLLEQAVHETVRAIQNEAEAIRAAGDTVVDTKRSGEKVLLSEKVAAWGRASESLGRIVAIRTLSAAYMTVNLGDLDADPWKLNVLNGTIAIKRDGGDTDPIELRPHDPADFITKLAPVRYDPKAVCPRYDAFLAHVQPHPEMRRFLHQWFGYSLTGDTSEQKLVFFHGSGRNGKSTLVDVVGTIAGDYGQVTPIETFTDQGRSRNAGGPTPDLAMLPGVRLLRTSEPEKGAKLAEALIKLVTGGEPILARPLHGAYFRFQPDFKLTMSGNHRPAVTGTDEGIWRRMVLVPWAVTVDAPDRRLPEKLQEEVSGILNRLLDGLRDFLDAGSLVLPETVREATADYREDSDPLGRFLQEAVDPAVGQRVQAGELHRLFDAWALANGERQWKPKGLAMALKERGYRMLRSNGSWWLDIRLLKHEIDYVQPPTPHPRGPDDG